MAEEHKRQCRHLGRLRLRGDGRRTAEFQWFFNSLPIAGATTTQLTLTNVQPFQAGQYTVQVTNPSASITSLSATLGVKGPGTLPTITPQISIAITGPDIRLSFPVNPGRDLLPGLPLQI